MDGYIFKFYYSFVILFVAYNVFFFFSFLISFGPLIESVSLRKIMFYKVPEFPDKMSTDHEDQVLGKQRPGWQNGPRRGPDIDWDAGP